MGKIIALPSEMWFKPACLMVSVIMHVGLGFVCWQSLEALSIDERVIVVALVDRPASVPVKPAAGVSSPRDRKPAVRPLRAPALATRPVTVVQPKEPQETVPAAADADARLAEDGEDPADGSLGDAGEGTGWGTGRGGDRASRESADRLIKATPRIEYNSTPVYPDVARERRWEGTVRVRARVTASGDVESVSLERSSGHAMLDRSALEAVRQWRFIPATRNGVPVASEASVQVPFHLPK